MTIGGFLDLALRRGDDQKKVALYLNLAMDAAKRLESMAGAVGRYAAVGRPRIETFDLCGLLREAMHTLDQKAAGLGKTIAWSMELTDISLQGDPAQLGAALSAVLENALEASHGAPDAAKDITADNAIPIALSLCVADAQAILRVRDHGRGIPAKDLPHVCEPFFTTKAVGAGMGLSLAKRILQEHRGRLDIVSQEGRGTTVTLTLPLGGDRGIDHGAQPSE